MTIVENLKKGMNRNESKNKAIKKRASVQMVIISLDNDLTKAENNTHMDAITALGDT